MTADVSHFSWNPPADHRPEVRLALFVERGDALAAVLVGTMRL
jgi:hypothetical protein